MALTATATPRVSEDIVAQLRMRDAVVFTSSFNRPNLTYYVHKKGAHVIEAMAERLVEKHFDQNIFIMPGIVYCLSRADCEKVAEELQARSSGVLCLPCVWIAILFFFFLCRAPRSCACARINVETRGGAARVQKLLREKLEAKLRRRVPAGVRLADFYHASRSPEEREAVQRAWMAGDTLILAATVAFGMGIDKADVRHSL